MPTVSASSSAPKRRAEYPPTLSSLRDTKRCRRGRASLKTRPFQRRLMEVAAGFTEHVDVQVGRIVDEIEGLGYGDNTLIFYVWGDNGSSAEGQDGTVSELLAQNGIPTTVKQHIAALEEIGGLDELGSPKTD